VVAAGVVALLSGLPSAAHLLARTNEDDTAAWLDEAIALVPSRDACVVALLQGDGPKGHKTQRALPAYLLRPPHRDVALYGFEDWQRAGQPRCRNGTYLLVDHRCSALHRDHRRQTGQTAAGLVAPCREVLAAHPWQPVRTRQLPHHGDNEYGYYGDARGFEVGVYRLDPPAAGSLGH
jgi:hypothetical protein